MMRDGGEQRGRDRIRAFRTEDGKGQVARCEVVLTTLFAGPGELQRALRQARRARLQGCGAYDLARHAALLRLARDGRSGGA